MDSCRQAIPGASYTLTGNGLNLQQGPATGSRHTVSSGGGCPLQGGNCQTVPVGCVRFDVPIPGSGSMSYVVSESQTPAGYVPCNGGSACLGQIANLVIDATGAIRATVTNTYPDSFVRTFPSPDPNTGASFYTGAQTDPAVFHDFQLGPGMCDGDNNLDDQLTGSPSSHCDGDTDISQFLAIAITSSTGAMQTGNKFNALKSRGGTLVASPAVIAGKTALQIGTWSDNNLHVRSDSISWQTLSSLPVSCVDDPAAYLDNSTGTLWVACERSDDILIYATAPMTNASTSLPQMNNWKTLPGLSLAAGPAIAPVGTASSNPTIFAVGQDGQLWSATVSTAWQALGGQCTAHPAAARGNTAGTPVTLVGCQGLDHNLQYGLIAADGTFTGLASAAATVPNDPSINPYSAALSSGMADGPGAAGLPHGVMLVVKGAADSAVYVKAVRFTDPLNPVGSVQVTWYQSFGYQVAYGPAAAS